MLEREIRKAERIENSIIKMKEKYYLFSDVTAHRNEAEVLLNELQLQAKSLIEELMSIDIEKPIRIERLVRQLKDELM